jgi:hypothetical protein
VSTRASPEGSRRRAVEPDVDGADAVVLRHGDLDAAVVEPPAGDGRIARLELARGFLPRSLNTPVVPRWSRGARGC